MTESAAQKHILIIDDEEMIVDILKRRFERMGFQVTTAHDGNSGIDELQARKVDLVVCDIKMPNGTAGGDVLRASMASSPETKFVAISGQLMSDDSVKEILQDGADMFIKKPFPSLNEVTARIVNLIE
jgi:two-component system nitrogen regulation response regulator NtrX